MTMDEKYKVAIRNLLCMWRRETKAYINVIYNGNLIVLDVTKVNWGYVDKMRSYTVKIEPGEPIESVLARCEAKLRRFDD